MGATGFNSTYRSKPAKVRSAVATVASFLQGNRRYFIISLQGRGEQIRCSFPAAVERINRCQHCSIKQSNWQSKLGGNWQLNVTAGQVKAAIAFTSQTLATYSSVLATLVDETFQNANLVGPWIFGINGTSQSPALTSGIRIGNISGFEHRRSRATGL
ncbi:MAG: DUF4347 domain-containing protein [Microcoleus sp. SM1_3_4]|nr:DUF4347 domain-containing protein [Microcoleus sp. SM1_3_4]